MKRGVKTQRKEGSFPPVSRPGLVERKMNHGSRKSARSMPGEPRLCVVVPTPRGADNTVEGKALAQVRLIKGLPARLLET